MRTSPSSPTRRSSDLALYHAFQKTELNYRYVENSIIIFPEPVKKSSPNEDHAVLRSASNHRMNRKEDVVVPALIYSSSLKLETRRLIFNVSGRVYDAEGEPLIGVNILVKGTNKGTTTDFDGRFSLDDIDENAVLVFSYVGYQTRELPVGGQRSLDVFMIADSQLLDEVVVVGYGTMKRSDLSGASVTLGEDQLKGTIVTNLDQALQGRAAGVTSVMTSGAPGSSVSVRIRGQATLNAEIGRASC